jgi:hypothetical protein
MVRPVPVGFAALTGSKPEFEMKRSCDVLETPWLDFRNGGPDMPNDRWKDGYYPVRARFSRIASSLRPCWLVPRSEDTEFMARPEIQEVSARLVAAAAAIGAIEDTRRIFEGVSSDKNHAADLAESAASRY